MTPYLKALPKVSTRRYGKFFYPYLDVWHSGQRTRLHIGCKVLVSQWCKEKQRAYISPLLNEIENYNNKAANDQIDAFVSRYMDFVDYICKSNKLENFVIELTNYMARPRKQQVQQIDVFKIIQNAVINSNDLAKGTRENYAKGIKALRAFSDYRSTPISSFDKFDADLIEEFVEFLADGNYLNNGKPYAMASLNSIIRYAVSAIKCVPTSYLSKAQARTIPQPKLTDKTARNNEIGLRDSEIIKLWKYQPTTKSDEEIRDMFLLLCLTGQRVGDLENIDGGFVTENGIPCLKLVQEKCSHKLSTDIVFPLAIEILNKYTKLPIVNLKRRINDNIGRIAKEAGISGEEQISIHRQGHDKPTVTKVDRTSLIHSHTGRRTFVSILRVHNWLYEEIGKYTGQSKAIVEHYDKSTSIDKRIFEASEPEDQLMTYKELGSQVQSLSQTQQPPAPTAQPQLKSLPNSIDEAKRVLNFLGYPPDAYMEVDSLDTLLRLIAVRESFIINGFNLEKMEAVKEIFNEQADITKRKQHLHNLITLWKSEGK